MIFLSLMEIYFYFIIHSNSINNILSHYDHNIFLYYVNNNPHSLLFLYNFLSILNPLISLPISLLISLLIHFSFIIYFLIPPNHPILSNFLYLLIYNSILLFLIYSFLQFLIYPINLISL